MSNEMCTRFATQKFPRLTKLLSHFAFRRSPCHLRNLDNIEVAAALLNLPSGCLTPNVRFRALPRNLQAISLVSDLMPLPEESDNDTDTIAPTDQGVLLKPDTSFQWAYEPEPERIEALTIPVTPEAANLAKWHSLEADEALKRSAAVKIARDGSSGEPTDRLGQITAKETWRRTAVDENNQRQVVGTTKETNLIGSDEAATGVSDEAGQIPHLKCKVVGPNTDVMAGASKGGKKGRK